MERKLFLMKFQQKLLIILYTIYLMDGMFLQHTLQGIQKFHAIWAQANGADIYFEAVRGDNAIEKQKHCLLLKSTLNQYKGSKNSFQNGGCY